MAFWSQADLEARIGAETVRQILDDNVDGTVDSAPLARLQADSDSYVMGFVRGIYTLSELEADTPNELKRLSLDVAVAYAVDRWPDYVRANGERLLERARRDLVDLRNGVTRLDVDGSPEPAANQGGTVLEPEAREEEDVAQIFTFGETGDF